MKLLYVVFTPTVTRTHRKSLTLLLKVGSVDPAVGYTTIYGLSRTYRNGTGDRNVFRNSTKKISNQHTVAVIIPFGIRRSTERCGVKYRVRKCGRLEGVTKGVPRLEQYDGKDNRFEKARFDKGLLKYLQKERVGARVCPPLSHCETRSIGRDQLRCAHQLPQKLLPCE